MFTGIVEEVGRVVDIEHLPDNAARLTVHGPTVLADAGTGDSIAVNGVCLTVTREGADPARQTFTADVMAETLAHTALGALTPGAPVNLERAVTPSTRLGGHIVQGHVDGTATLLERTPSEHWEVLRFSLPTDLAPYLVAKGSIAVNGVSLTVVQVGGSGGRHWFTVSLIPTTLRDTVLGELAVGEPVNLEVDIVAKYVESLMKGVRP